MTDSQLEALALLGVSKRFGGTTALDDVSLHVGKGRVHALLGENGAGKTTLMRVAFGMARPETGTVRVQGRQAHIHTPADAIAAGIGMVHQHFTLVPAMTVTENLALGGHGRLRPHDTVAAVREIASVTGFVLDPSARIDALSVGAQQRVEIAKALVRGANVLVLDEPTAVLAPAESDDLLRWLRRFADGGNAVVLITHKLAEALSIADDVTVLRHGRVVHTGPAALASAQSLTTAMIGRNLVAAKPNATAILSHQVRPPILVARNITLCDERGKMQLHDATMLVREGEIVGLAGVEGAGHRELLRALAGRRPVSSGHLEIPARVGFVPEDRHRDAVLLDRSLVDNVALRNAGHHRGRIRWHALRLRTQSLMREFDVRAPTVGAPMRILSGGNQQKLVLAREMAETGPSQILSSSPSNVSPSALICENPTRGLDIRATADVHARLRAARDQGVAVVIYSSDLDEVLTLASRMLVAYAGTLREVAVDRDSVGRAMVGLD